MKQIKQKKIKKGFSLIEVLFAVIIMVLAITGVVFLLTNSSKSIQDSKNQVIAAQLAQEGIELIRNLKENNNLVGSDYESAGGPFTGRVDYSSTFSRPADVNQSYQLRIPSSGSNRFFSHSTGTASKFYRKICLSVAGSVATNPPIKPYSDRVVTVNSFVTWRNGGFSFSGCDISNNCTLGNKCVSAISVLPDLPN